MAAVIRLLTVVELHEDGDPLEMSVAARHEAVLDDGRRVVLLDDRGWTEALRGAGATGGADVWQSASEHEIAETARTVVGPDAPFGGRTRSDMERSHWDTLADTLRAYGVSTDGSTLSRLPHDVVLGERLRARLGTGPGA